MTNHRGASEAVELRRTKAMGLRVQGYTYRAIGEQLGVQGCTAYQDVQEVLKRNRKEADESAEEIRQIDLERIGVALVVCSKIVEDLGADQELRLKAIDRLVRLLERHSKLLGLDAPSKQEVLSTNVEARPEEAARLVREAFGGKVSHEPPATG